MQGRAARPRTREPHTISPRSVAATSSAHETVANHLNGQPFPFGCFLRQKEFGFTHGLQTALKITFRCHWRGRAHVSSHPVRPRPVQKQRERDRWAVGALVLVPVTNGVRTGRLRQLRGRRPRECGSPCAGTCGGRGAHSRHKGTKHFLKAAQFISDK